MGKLLKLNMILNKSNKQVSLTLPKKQMTAEMRKDLVKFKKARIWLDGFE